MSVSWGSAAPVCGDLSRHLGAHVGDQPLMMMMLPEMPACWEVVALGPYGCLMNDKRIATDVSRLKNSDTQIFVCLFIYLFVCLTLSGFLEEQTLSSRIQYFCKIVNAGIQPKLPPRAKFSIKKGIIQRKIEIEQKSITFTQRNNEIVHSLTT